MEEVKERVVEEVKGGVEENVPRSTKKSRSIGQLVLGKIKFSFDCVIFLCM